MKKYIYMAMACLTMGLASCSNDPEDAVSKHVYGPDENPYLRADETATIATELEFRVGHIAPKTIYLKDHAETIQKKLGMTVDDMLTGLDNGKVVFYNINTNKRAWDKTAPNNGTGWSYNDKGMIATDNAVASVVLDKTQKCLTIDAPKDTPAGVSMTVNIGFAIDNGADYDKYVRFSLAISVGDPGLYITSVNIPAGDYQSAPVDFNKCTEQIEKCLNMTVSEFASEVKSPDNDIAMYVIGADGKWQTEANYTANGIGYWCNANDEVVNWGDGCLYYIETAEDGYSVNIGRYPNVDSGTSKRIRFLYAKKSDPSQFVEFLVDATFQ